MPLRLLGSLGLFMLAGLLWWAGVRDVVARKATRRGLGEIISGIGLLTWGLLGVAIFPREKFSTTADWGIFIVSGVFILIGAILSHQTQSDSRDRVGPSLRIAARLLGEKRARHGEYEDRTVQEVMDSVERRERDSNRETRNHQG